MHTHNGTNDIFKKGIIVSNKPTHNIYHVRDGKEEDQAYWTKVGAAWVNKDGKGYNLTLDLLPTNGKLVMREIEVKD